MYFLEYWKKHKKNNEKLIKNYHPVSLFQSDQKNIRN